MKILLTGASSFTGTWFASALASDGHQIFGTLRGRVADYGPAQQARFDFMRKAGVHFLEAHSFGDDAFLRTLGDGFDVVCVHGADVRDYRSPDFDIVRAVTANSLNLRQVIRVAKETGVSRLIATGSIFEEGEGAGEPPLNAVSPYGLSKSITWSLTRACCEWADMPVAKFVIPNPFGPYEEPRFCAYLMRNWAGGKTAQVNTPDYIRDNIPVDLLAAAYVDLVNRARNAASTLYARPSCYVESQGSFTQRFAKEIGTRLGLPTPLIFARQTEFQEPRMRVNTDRVMIDWDESASWDKLAAYYKTLYLPT